MPTAAVSQLWADTVEKVVCLFGLLSGVVRL
jgi:hypothetical protein